jgi:hypothetical protein
MPVSRGGRFQALARIAAASRIAKNTIQFAQERPFLSPALIGPPDVVGVPHWHNLWARQPFGFDKIKTAEQLNQALQEFPPPRSLKTFGIETDITLDPAKTRSRSM